VALDRHRTVSGREYLICRYVTAPDVRVDEGALRRRLHDRLSRTEVPARLRCVRSLADPRDEPGLPRPPIGTPFRAPVNALEDEVTDTWADLLGLEEIGVDDDFFELGASSLIAVEAVVRLGGVLDPDGELDVPFELLCLDLRTAGQVCRIPTRTVRSWK